MAAANASLGDLRTWTHRVYWGRVNIWHHSTESRRSGQNGAPEFLQPRGKWWEVDCFSISICGTGNDSSIIATEMRFSTSILKGAWLRKLHVVLGGDSWDTHGAAWNLCIKFAFVLDTKETRQNFLDYIVRWTLQMHASRYPSLNHRHSETFLYLYPANIHEEPELYVGNKSITFRRTLPLSNIVVLDGILNTEYWILNTKCSMKRNGMISIKLDRVCTLKGYKSLPVPIRNAERLQMRCQGNVSFWGKTPLLTSTNFPAIIRMNCPFLFWVLVCLTFHLSLNYHCCCYVYIIMILDLRKKLVKCYIWSTALYGAETWTLRAADQKYLVSFGEGWKRSVGPIMWETNKCCFRSMSRGVSYMK